MVVQLIKDITLDITASVYRWCKTLQQLHRANVARKVKDNKWKCYRLYNNVPLLTGVDLMGISERQFMTDICKCFSSGMCEHVKGGVACWWSHLTVTITMLLQVEPIKASSLLLCRDCDMWPKPRLGKRSPLGELLSAPYPAGGPLTGRVPAEADTALATGAWQLSSGRVKGHHVLRVSEMSWGGALGDWFMI